MWTGSCFEETFRLADEPDSAHSLCLHRHYSQKSPFSMATKYELPEEINEKLLGTLGKEVEMQTFKSNFVDSDEDDRVVKMTWL